MNKQILKQIAYIAKGDTEQGFTATSSWRKKTAPGYHPEYERSYHGPVGNIVLRKVSWTNELFWYKP